MAGECGSGESGQGHEFYSSDLHSSDLGPAARKAGRAVPLWLRLCRRSRAGSLWCISWFKESYRAAVSQGVRRRVSALRRLQNQRPEFSARGVAATCSAWNRGTAGASPAALTNFVDGHELMVDGKIGGTHPQATREIFLLSTLNYQPSTKIGCQDWTRTNTVRFNKPSC